MESGLADGFLQLTLRAAIGVVSHVRGVGDRVHVDIEDPRNPPEGVVEWLRASGAPQVGDENG